MLGVCTNGVAAGSSFVSVLNVLLAIFVSQDLFSRNWWILLPPSNVRYNVAGGRPPGPASGGGLLGCGNRFLPIGSPPSPPGH